MTRDCRVLLDDWQQHRENVAELEDAIFTYSTRQSVMNALLTELKFETITTHEYWQKLQESGFTSQEEAARAHLEQHKGEF